YGNGENSTYRPLIRATLFSDCPLRLARSGRISRSFAVFVVCLARQASSSGSTRTGKAHHRFFWGAFFLLGNIGPQMVGEILGGARETGGSVSKGALGLVRLATSGV